jgi:hypothetical protein
MENLCHSPKRIPLLNCAAIVILGLLPAVSKAQSDSTAKQPATETYMKNSVKINVTSLFIKSYNFSYERSLSEKFSVAAGYSTMPENAIADLPVIKKIAGDFFQDDNDVDLDQITVSNHSFTGEFRYYLGKRAARGIYLSGYGRYTSMKVGYQYAYQVGGRSYNFPIQSDLKGFGGGVMVGIRQLVAKRVVLDFYLLGGHYGNLSGDASGVTDLSALTPAQKNDLKNELDNLIELNGKKYLTSTVTDNGVTAKVDGPFLGIRFGVNVGIAF